MSATEARDEPIDLLKGRMVDPDPAVRFNAGLDLVKRGEPCGVPALIEGFAHDSGVVRLFHAGRALEELGAPAVPALEAALEESRVRVRVDAALILARIDPARRETLLPVALAALSDPDGAAQEDAVSFLGEAQARAAIPEICRLLQEAAPLEDREAWATDPRIRLCALLGHLASPAEGEETADEGGVSGLATALRESDTPSTRWAAARALGELGRPARSALPALAAVVRDEEEAEAVRVEAAYSFAVMGDAAETLPALFGMLASRDPWVRLFAARILGETGCPVSPPPEDRQRSWWGRAAVARRQVQSIAEAEPVVAALAAALADPDANVRRNAAYALSRFGERAQGCVPALIESLDVDETGPVAAEALARVGEAGVPALAACLAEIGEERRSLAAYALRLIDSPAAREALETGMCARPTLDFAPAVCHFYSTAPVSWTCKKRSAFEALYRETLARGPGREVEYALPYPRHEFLRYLVEEERHLLHGTDRRDLEVLQPLRFSTDSSDHGNVSGVYADRDPIRPIYFAVVHRGRCFGLNNGFFDLTETGEPVEGDAPTCERRYYRLAISVNGLRRDPWRRGMVYVLPEESFSYWKEWTSRTPVRPLMRLGVGPEDLPLRDQVWGVDWRQGIDSWVRPDQPFPFLTDVQATPVRPLLFGRDGCRA
jgi:HEAT repeat protein